MIITKLMGGLGNQMFQVATAYALATKYNTKFKLDLSFLNKNNISTESFTAREYELAVFNKKFEFASQNDLDFFFPKNKKIIVRFTRKIKRLLHNPQIIIDNWNPIGFFEKKSSYIYLDGYWQSEDYFKSYEQEIKKLFQFPTIDDIRKDLVTEIRAFNSVSIHFRRGDYANNSHVKAFHGLLEFDYYQRAMNHINSVVINPKYYIFSDDPEWVKMHFENEIDFTIIDTESGIKDMYLMSLCKHNIIANSSFSWCAAWLNTNPGKIVVVPKKWFNANDLNYEHVIPENWQKL